MSIIRTEELLRELTSITELNKQTIEEHVSKLSKEQLNWKKDNISWSIIETLAHLNEFASYYNEIISQKIDKTRFREPRVTFVSSPLGRSAWISMKLGNAQNVKRKLRSQKLYNPVFNREIELENSTKKFIDHQIDLLNILSKAGQVNLRKVRIPTSISKLIRLKLGDALMFVIYHNQRHVRQVLNVIADKNFPKIKSES
jgi:hypothetical protein